MSDINTLHEIIGDELMQAVCDQLGGCRVYIPHTVPWRGEVIAAEFNRVVHTEASVGSAYNAVAEAMHVSPRTVQRVVCGR